MKKVKQGQFEASAKNNTKAKLSGMKCEEKIDLTELFLGQYKEKLSSGRSRITNTAPEQRKL